MTQTDTPTPRPEAAARMKPWLRIVLFTSLALNIAVIGLVAGAALRHGGERHGKLTRSAEPGVVLLRALDSDDRRALRDAIRAEMPRDRARPSAGAGFAPVLEALRAETFDPAAAEAALTAQVAGMQQRHEIGRRHLLDRIAAMTPGERRAFADRVEAEMAQMATRRKNRPQD